MNERRRRYQNERSSLFGPRNGAPFGTSVTSHAGDRGAPRRDAGAICHRKSRARRSRLSTVERPGPGGVSVTERGGSNRENFGKKLPDRC